MSRRKWRLGLLDEIFAPHLAEVDSNFLRRLKNSNLANSDARKAFKGSLLFPDQTDEQFFKKYPTIYHLRQALMTEKHKFDIREVYLAMHHIIKYRGNFLSNAPVSQFSVNDMALASQFERLNTLFQNLKIDFQIDAANAVQIKAELIDQNTRRMDRKKLLKRQLAEFASDKKLAKRQQSIATEIINAFLEYKFKLNIILNKAVDDAKEWQLSFADEAFDSNLDKISDDFNNDELEIIEILRNICGQVKLTTIVPENMGLSESMIAKYDKHHKDLEKYKQLIDSVDAKRASALKTAYALYVNSVDGKNVTNQGDFYSDVKKNLDDSELAQEILADIELEQFMPKQRTSANGVIPHQLHQIELDQIIENQRQYYPFLAELNPNKARQQTAKYKLDELVAFRVPYYVGPLITAEDQKKTSGAEFAWMRRKQSGRITPWNFDEKVDRQASANAFIRRMTNKDSYLISEDVLPDESLLYQKYKVLNTLNGIRVNHQKLSVPEKQQIFEGLFKQQNHVSVKNLQNFLVSSGKYLTAPLVEGLADPKKFDNTLSTYHKLKAIFPDKIDQMDYRADFENMVEWSTVFEDRKIFVAKLKEIKWLNEAQIQEVSTMRTRGWGRFSKKLLTGIHNENGESIMDILWNTNQNFMQAKSDPEISAQIKAANHQTLNNDDLEAILADTFTSPQNKKAIRQVIKVVQDVVQAIGYAPAKIATEFARGKDKNPQRTKTRYAQMLAIFEGTAKNLADETLRSELNRFANKRQLSDRYLLYFSQLGKDMYTGTPLDIDNISNYEIDHILPQSFLKDDELNNRVLVQKAVNNAKSDRVPLKAYGQKMGSFWKQLADAGLISQHKLKNLLTDPDALKKYEVRGFINRQLVETRQVIRLTAEILDNIYAGEGTKIVEIRAQLNSQLRAQFHLVKVREVNDYHHGFDAYLTALLGHYLYQRYPKLRPAFVYGDFRKLLDTDDRQDHWNFNFVGQLATKAQIKNMDGALIWDKAKNLKLLQQIYNYKFMLISHEVSEENGALFNQTIYPKSLAAKSKLIPIAKGKDPKLYGGHSSNNDAYMAIVSVKHKFKVVGIPLRFLPKIKAAQAISQEAYLATLKEVLAPQFMRRKRGSKAQVSDDFKVILPRVLYGQLIIDGTDKYTLGSAAYKHNARQLVLSPKSLLVLDKHRRDTVTDDALMGVYDEILAKVNQYFSLYDTNRFRKGLNDGRSKFAALPIKDVYTGDKLVTVGKLTVLTRILIGLHANGTTADLKVLDIKTPLGKMQSGSGIVLSSEAKLVYQSITGLFERSVKISEL
ncbi:type II CRISPR RNA-guided endonuclease Cas9 [Agrilactobacillus fermenti]|uniref:type II CRISPR RNA-guided endonuclease Cas9 n=1 Tax=Agrilactobacillus fermenti TaxID=2586909 RepID=UPI003A5C6FE8